MFFVLPKVFDKDDNGVIDAEEFLHAHRFFFAVAHLEVSNIDRKE